MDVPVYTERKAESAELRELLGVGPLSLMINKGRLRLFGHFQHKDVADWSSIL